MTDREKLYDLIVDAENEFHKNHHYAEDSKRIESVVDYLIAHGGTVKEMQKPLTVEEVMETPCSVWYENDIVIAPMMVSNRESFSILYLKDVVFGWYRSSCVDCFASIELPVSDYGKTWRCWKEKPSDEERMAAEWLK